MNWKAKHHCSHCKQSLIAVHPLEVKRAIWILTTLANNPKAHNNTPLRTIGGGVHAEYSMLTWQLENYPIATAARTAAALEIEPDTSKWKSWLPEDYRLAAQKLSDMWLPPGYILDPHMEVTCERAVMSSTGCSGDKHVGACLSNPDYLKDYK